MVCTGRLGSRNVKGMSYMKRSEMKRSLIVHYSVLAQRILGKRGDGQDKQTLLLNRTQNRTEPG
jgi:hypothetical protein